MRARSTFISVVVAMCACGNPPIAHVPVEPPPAPDPIAPPLVFEPTSVDAYEVPAPAMPKDPAADAIFASMQELANGRGLIARDPRLDAVATEVATVVARGAAPSDELVAFALRAHGVIEPAAATVVLRAGDDLGARFGDRLFLPNVRVGLGGSPMVAIIVFKSAVTLAATPRFATQDFTIEATLQPKHHDPEVAVVHEDGDIEHLAITGNGVSFSVPFTCGGHHGPQWLDISADKAQVAALPIYCVTPPPKTFRIEPASNLSPANPVRRLASIINRERLAAGLTALAEDPRATAAARRQAEMMLQAGTVSHEIENSTPAQRLRDAGLIPPVLFESTMHVHGLGRVAELLMNDPAYQAPLDSPVATHMGIAMVPDAKGDLFVALIYVQLVAPVDVHVWADTIVGKLRAVWPQARLDVALTRIAHRYAEQLAMGWHESTLWPSIQLDLQSSGRTYSGKTIRAVVTVDELDAKTMVGTPDLVTDIGIGVVQSRRDGPQAGRVWVVVFFR
jgi:hypothetical protein